MNKDDKNFPNKKQQYYKIYHSKDDLEKERLFRDTFADFAEKLFEHNQTHGKFLGDCFSKEDITNPLEDIKKQWRQLLSNTPIASQLIPIDFTDNTLTIFCKIPFQMDIIRQQHQANILQNIQKQFPIVHEIQLTIQRLND